MKSMDEYISSVYKKYEETENSNQIYKSVRMKAYNPLNKIYGVTACLALVVAFCIGVNYLKVNEPVEEIKYASTEVKEESGSIIYTKFINVDYKFKEHLKKLIQKVELVTIVSDFNMTDCDYEIKTERFAIKTIGNLAVNKVLKSNGKLFDNQLIEVSKYCGKASLEQLEKDDLIDWDEWERTNIGYVVPKEQKANIYFQQLPSKGYDFEDGKQYLAFMNYNEDEQIYEIADIACGIVEYDPNTNMIKNIDTGEFEEFDWSLIK